MSRKVDLETLALELEIKAATRRMQNPPGTPPVDVDELLIKAAQLRSMPSPLEDLVLAPITAISAGLRAAADVLRGADDNMARAVFNSTAALIDALVLLDARTKV